MKAILLQAKMLFSFDVGHHSSKHQHTLGSHSLPGLVPGSQKKTLNEHLINEQEKEGKNE